MTNHACRQLGVFVRGLATRQQHLPPAARRFLRGLIASYVTGLLGLDAVEALRTRLHADQGA
jgi:hypothetical protein